MSKVETKIYAARSNDDNILSHSASGGMFTVISDLFVKKHYAIACTVYNYQTNEAEFKLITSQAERDNARRSLYIQSNPNNIYRESVDWLLANQDKELLFVGTGCQAAGFVALAESKRVRHRCLVVDLICHGVPSPGVWKDYISSIENKNSGKINLVNFKDKRYGWRESNAIAKVAENEISLNKYVMAFNKGYTLRPSCYRCPYTKIDRYTDITIGDYWHIEDIIPDFYNNMGNSLVLLHTDKGKKFFSTITNCLEYRESNCRNCWQFNLERPTLEPVDRMDFWRTYKRYGVEVAMKKYGDLPMWFRVKVLIKKYLVCKKDKFMKGICYGKDI